MITKRKSARASSPKPSSLIAKAQARASKTAFKQAVESTKPSRPRVSTNAVKASAEAAARQFVVIEDKAGQRLDNFLFRELKGVPKSLLYRLLREGVIRVDGKRAKPDLKLIEGVRIDTPAIRVPSAGAPVLPAREELDWLKACIVHQDRNLIVLNKPHGLASHGGSGISLGAIEAMRALFPEQALELVHRLDRETSGLLLIALNRSTLRELQNEIKSGGMSKHYVLIAHGRAPRARFEIRAPLTTHERQGGQRKVRVDTGGKHALTEFDVLKQFAHHVHLRARILTGRTHQIRVHALTAGLPIVGDDKYGDPARDRDISARGFRRMALHAQSLELTLKGERVRFEAPMPADFVSLLADLARPDGSKE